MFREFTDYQSYIAKSKYSRYLPDKKRRENWDETVLRFMTFIQDHLDERGTPLKKEELEEIYKAILNRDVMPSMRLLMTAGPAAKRDNTCAYNCAYLAVDDQKAFDEAMFILLCGTGVGFSVEKQYVDKLPEVPDKLFWSDHTIVVHDSKEGWAKSLRLLVSFLYSGEIPRYDVSKVRKAGSRLKTFGGRASGPEPLVELFEFVIEKFKGAAGRKLSRLECHDIMCKIADIVVVGGVRRSAMISLSDLEDSQLAKCKTGNWWSTHPYRRLANNSAVFEQKPDMETFMVEWHNLYASKSGERGIFNRKASQAQAARFGRRPLDMDYGTNPCCVVGETILMTSEGPIRIDQLGNRPFTAVVNGKEYAAPHGSWVAGKSQVYKIKTLQGFEISCTKEHRFLTTHGWKQAIELKSGDKIYLHNHVGNHSWGGDGDYGQGYLLGGFAGDGNFSRTVKGVPFGEVKLWDHDLSIVQKEFMLNMASKINHRSDWKGWRHTQNYSVMSIGKLPLEFGFKDHTSKAVPSSLELCSSDFQKGFVVGNFDADGHVEGNDQKGYRISLGSIDRNKLQIIQRMLLRQAVYSRIYKLRDAQAQGIQGYPTKTCWRLHVSSKSLKGYYENFGFIHERKQAELKAIINKIEFYNKPFVATFKELESQGEQIVWDAHVDEVHAFDANGFYAHNSEIILRAMQFCNLTSIIARAEDDKESMQRKIRIAAMLGTIQATLTKFPYLRKQWHRNTEQEALLGVSITGILDCQYLWNSTDGELESLRDLAVQTNVELAERLGINRAAAVTCVKPEGTVSQLCGTSSGIHAQHSEFYIRTVRADNKDPMTNFMKEYGIPHEPCVSSPSTTTVFSFPMKAPEGSHVRDEIDVIDHLELWLKYQRCYCEHKPSITISVKEDEWMKVGAWVYDHFDEVTGISFLPYDGGVYKQAPYQEITKEQYEEAMSKMPSAGTIMWDMLEEEEDNVEGAQQLSCSAGYCDM